MKTAFQDGGTFYMEGDDPSECEFVQAPISVADGDMEAAAKARAWFIENHPEVELE